MQLCPHNILFFSLLGTLRKNKWEHWMQKQNEDFIRKVSKTVMIRNSVNVHSLQLILQGYKQTSAVKTSWICLTFLCICFILCPFQQYFSYVVGQFPGHLSWKELVLDSFPLLQTTKASSGDYKHMPERGYWIRNCTARYFKHVGHFIVTGHA